jgi:hypothetical protein
MDKHFAQEPKSPIAILNPPTKLSRDFSEILQKVQKKGAILKKKKKSNS